jgi:predicted signal transduction protein with EAL and GGDEF domain
MDKTVVIDVSGIDGIRRTDHAHLKESPIADEQHDFEIPEEYMDRLEDLLGDGKASITVGAELKFSDFGNGYNSSVFVKLTCGQDMDTILATREVGQELAAKFSREGFDAMRHAYDEALGLAPATVEVKQNAVPAKIKTPAKATKKAGKRKKFTIQR